MTWLVCSPAVQTAALIGVFARLDDGTLKWGNDEEEERRTTDPERLLRRWDTAVSKIRLRCSMSRSPAVRELYESLTSEIGELTGEEYAQMWLQLLDLLEREFGPLWPKSPNAN
jgi:hypothetical protein